MLAAHYKFIAGVAQGMSSNYEYYCSSTYGQGYPHCSTYWKGYGAMNCGNNFVSGSCKAYDSGQASPNGLSDTYIVERKVFQRFSTTSVDVRARIWKRKAGAVGTAQYNPVAIPEHLQPQPVFDPLPTEGFPDHNLTPGIGTPAEPFVLPQPTPFPFRAPQFKPGSQPSNRPGRRRWPRPRPRTEVLPGDVVVTQTPAPRPWDGPTFEIAFKPTPGARPGARPSPGRGNPRPRPGDNTKGHERKPPPRGRKEKKYNAGKAFARFIRVLNASTEVLDVVDALWKALPARFKTRVRGVQTTPQQKALDLWAGMQGMTATEWTDFVGDGTTNLITEQAEDMLYGAIGRVSANSSANVFDTMRGWQTGSWDNAGVSDFYEYNRQQEEK